MRLVVGEERWEAPDPQSNLLKNWDGTELHRTITCMVLMTSVHLADYHDESRGSGSDALEIMCGIRNHNTVNKKSCIS
ncbi:hypothetical protein TNCV_853671 [Trichonephila clavipes]|nr:hypothetical protein TNCV_853671 [Trichonephila clavipes]